MADAEVGYFWYEAPVPDGLRVTQVYGYLICRETCRVLVQDDDGVFNLPGGKPEPGDGGWAGTLAREALEENQVRVGACAYLGYQEVQRPARRLTRRSGWRGSSRSSPLARRTLTAAGCTGG